MFMKKIIVELASFDEDSLPDNEDIADVMLEACKRELDGNVTVRVTSVDSVSDAKDDDDKKRDGKNDKNDKNVNNIHSNRRK